MIEFSAILESIGLPTTIHSEDDISRIIDAFDSHLKKRNLWQYYVMDVKAEREAVKKALASQDVVPWVGADVAHKSAAELAEIVRGSGHLEGYRKLEKRFCTHVSGPVAAGIVKAAYSSQGNHDALADAWGKVVDVLNVPLYEEWNEDTRIALDSIRNRVKYTRLDDSGPKLGPISSK